ncbi:MAG TPA: polyhydroxyalkanoate depolymerase [Solibacterales bacterium]|nr:polyhydroxyalkanoate depolymerase [Bryobacterales bacterium]
MDLAHYTARRATAPMIIDGRLDEAAWRAAAPSSPFIDIVTGEPAWFDTRVRILWDDDHLYFGFTAEETHVWATLTERDSKIWLDNDLEIFIAGQDAYYEFEINAYGTIYEVFWVWQDMYREGSPYNVPEWNPAGRPLMLIDGIGGHVHPRGWRNGFLDYDLPGLRAAVHIDGTLNDPSDTDRGWSCEVAIPWAGLHWLADGRSLPPREGDVWRIDCSRFQHIGPRGERLDPAAGWTWNRHGHYDSHIPETFTFVHFSRDPAAA